MDNFKLSPHFSFFELTDSAEHPDLVEANRLHALGEDYLIRGVVLALLLERCRSILGVPIRVSSGHRGPLLNDAVGGAENSQHLEFSAADIHPITSGPNPPRADYLSAFSCLKKAFEHEDTMFGQLILETRGTKAGGEVNWIHVSIGFPLRRLPVCREIWTMYWGKWEMIRQLPLDPWRTKR